MKERKDVIFCPRCFSANVSNDKGFLPGGPDTMQFDIKLCNDCGYRSRMFPVADIEAYEELVKEHKKK
jgi:hypothetical protein